MNPRGILTLLDRYFPFPKLIVMKHERCENLQEKTEEWKFIQKNITN